MAKRILTAMLTLALLLSAAACGGGGGTPTQAPAADAPAPEAPQAPAPAAEGGFTFTGYPMDAKDTTITWWLDGGGPIPNSAYADWKESPFHTNISEMLGVNVEWSYPQTGTDPREAFNLLIAGGSYPDIMFSGSIMADAERLMNEGVMRDLTDYIERYSPNYYAWLQTVPAYDKAFKTDAGRYYGYGFFREDGGWNDTYQGPLVRQDWLDAQGLEAPKTIGDWDNVLRVFKDKYNAVFTGAWASRIKTGGNIAGAFGAYAGFNYDTYVDRSGKIQLAQAQPEFKDYLTQMGIWWRDGLIDQDIVSNGDAEARTKALNGETGLAFSSMGQLSSWELDANEAGNGAKWVGLQYPTGNDGRLDMVFGGYGIGNTATVVSTGVSDEKLEIVMRALDYAYQFDGGQGEGFRFWNFGKQGESWELDADGNPAYTDLVVNDPNGLNAATDKYGGAVWNGSAIQATLLLYLKNTETAIAANDLWFYPNEAVTAYYTKPRGMSFTEEESNNITDMEGAIRTYVEEAAVAFMTGARNVADFDSYLAELEGMGLSELLSYYQTSYDRYMAR